MFGYIVEYAGRNLLIQTDSKENFIKNIVSEFEKKNIQICSENIILNLYNSDLKIYYEINPMQLPDSTVLVKVHCTVQESASDPPTSDSAPTSSVVPGPSHLIERYVCYLRHWNRYII